jgi:hypothetical protein
MVKMWASCGTILLCSFLVEFAHSGRDVLPGALLWVHTPKTGSSFCLNLQHDQCYDRWPDSSSKQNLTYHQGCAVITGFSCKIDSVGHAPLPLKTPNYNVVMIFREPKSRIISSFTNYAHTEGMSKDYEKDLRLRMLKLSRRMCGRPPGGVKTECVFNARLFVYANDNATKGCVVKTLNGYWCMDNNVTVTQQMVDIAIKRIRTFYFVGIFEEWDIMLSKFYMKRNIPTPEINRVHIRKTQYKFNITSLMNDYTDPFDSSVYIEARSLAAKEPFRYPSLST